MYKLPEETYEKIRAKFELVMTSHREIYIDASRLLEIGKYGEMKVQMIQFYLLLEDGYTTRQELLQKMLLTMLELDRIVNFTLMLLALAHDLHLYKEFMEIQSGANDIMNLIVEEL